MPDIASQLNDPIARSIAGLLAAALVALAAYRVRALAPSGAIAATVVGGSMVASGGWWLGLVLIVYFTTSSALSIVAKRRQESTSQARGSRRDAVQVLANGAIPVAFAIVSLLASDPSAWLYASVGAIAGAASDTWATEIGRFSPSRPRLLTSGERVPPGTSGAITPHGTTAAIAASFTIALTAAIGHAAGWLETTGPTVGFVLIVSVAGVAGCFADSLLGATVQERRWCPVCQVHTERQVHTCGTLTTHALGLRWMNNDAVNLLGVFIAGVIAAVLSLLLQK